nr:DsbA family protein [Paracoccus saliphilus]
MNKPHLIYFADPMCSWCWGFSPVIDGISNEYGASLPIRLILGGLRPGTTEPLTETSSRDIREHWEHVHEASGQPFDFGFFERKSFIYNSEPASRAVVVARHRSMSDGLDFLKPMHDAFYAQNRDITDEQVLADLAAEVGWEREKFLQLIRSEEIRTETWQDFAISQNAGVTGFPCLIAGTGEQTGYSLVTAGYQPTGRILPAIKEFLQRPLAVGSPS